MYTYTLYSLHLLMCTRALTHHSARATILVWSAKRSLALSSRAIANSSTYNTYILDFPALTTAFVEPAATIDFPRVRGKRGESVSIRIRFRTPDRINIFVGNSGAEECRCSETLRNSIFRCRDEDFASEKRGKAPRWLYQLFRIDQFIVRCRRAQSLRLNN